MLPPALTVCDFLPTEQYLEIQGNSLNGTIPDIFSSMVALVYVAPSVVGDRRVTSAVCSLPLVRYCPCPTRTPCRAQRHRPCVQRVHGHTPDTISRRTSKLECATKFAIRSVFMHWQSYPHFCMIQGNRNASLVVAVAVPAPVVVAAAAYTEGTIPSSLSLYSLSLTYLDFSTNLLTGTVPAELSALTGLQRLALSSNKLSGTVPSQLSLFTKLSYVGCFETCNGFHAYHDASDLLNILTDCPPGPQTSW